MARRKEKREPRRRRLHGFNRFAFWAFLIMFATALAGRYWSSKNKNPVVVFGVKLVVLERFVIGSVIVLFAIMVASYGLIRLMERLSPVHQGDDRDEEGNPPPKNLDDDDEPPLFGWGRKRKR